MYLRRFAMLAIGPILALMCFSIDDVRAAPITDLTHLWNFENNSDDLVGGLDETAVGSTGFGTGKVGANSADFTGGCIDIASYVAR